MAAMSNAGAARFVDDTAGKQALATLLLIAALIGILGGHFAERYRYSSVVWRLVLEVLFSFVSFVWYCRDSDARGFVRTRWRSVAMVGVTPVAIPFYLWRSRPPGSRGRAILRFFGFAVQLLCATAFGMALGALLELVV